MNLAHKIRLEPKPAQVQALCKAVGCARFAYNWGLDQWNKQYAQGLKPSTFKLKKQFNEIKEELYPWIYDSPKDANQQAFANLGTAFSRFFKKQSKYPKFKKKFEHDSFYISNDKFYVTSSYVKLPVIGRVKLSEKLRFDGKIVGAVVSRKSDKWFISINVDIENPTKERVSDNIVGVDLGVKTFATLSNEEKFDAPKPLKKNLKKIKRQNRSVSRKVLGSKNRKKAIVKLSRTYYKTANIRKDFLDKLSTKLCRENQTIVIEDLNVTGMLKNHCLARAIADLGWSEFRRQLEYKSKIYGCKIVVADRFFPSSKLCPCCGHIKENLTLADRVFKCDCCGFEMDRDIKAAKLLAVLGTASPEITPEDMRALIYSSVIGINETVVSESGI